MDHPTSGRVGFNGAKKFICENGRVLIVVNLKNSLFSNNEISSKVTYFTSSNHHSLSFTFGGRNHGIFLVKQSLYVPILGKLDGKLFKGENINMFELH